MITTARTKTYRVLFLSTLIAILFLASVGYSFNIFPLLDSSIILNQKIIFRTFVVPLGKGKPERELSRIAKATKNTIGKDDHVYMVLSVQTDPVGDDSVNRKVGMELANWTGRYLIEKGVPGDRIGIVEPVEDKAFLKMKKSNFRASQKCTIYLVRGSNLLSRYLLMGKKSSRSKKTTGIIIYSPTERETDKGLHILKGETESTLTALAVTVNDLTRTISIFRGKFETLISLVPGENHISMKGVGPGGKVASYAFSIRYRPPKPTIEITSPKDGETVDIYRTPAVSIKGRIETRKKIVSAFLIHNGLPRRIKVDTGNRFDQKAVLLSRKDIFKVEVLDEEGFSGTSQEVKIKSSGIARQVLSVILNWNSDKVDLDLIILDDRGNMTFYDAPDRFRSHTSIPEGRLEVDDTDGFGPEIFNLTEKLDKKYDIFVNYFNGKQNTNAFITLILFPDVVPKTVVKSFGPFHLNPGTGKIYITSVKMPGGLFFNAPEHGEAPK